LLVLSQECSHQHMTQNSAVDSTYSRVTFAHQHYVDTTTEVRVAARGTPVIHATSRSKFIAAAVATCCKWVLASPRY